LTGILLAEEVESLMNHEIRSAAGKASIFPQLPNILEEVKTGK